MIKRFAPNSVLSSEGNPLPFPMHLSDEPLREYLGDYGHVPLNMGISATFEAFQELLVKGKISQSALE
jgi:hypothetical protein